LPKLRDVAITVSILKNGIHNLATGMFGWQHAIIKSNAEIERMTMLMRGMSKASTQAAKDLEAASNVDFVIDLAQNAPFQLQELTNSFVKFKSVGIDPTNGSLKSLTDAVAAFGGNDQILHRASVAIQQMAGKGVISMEELRQQLGEAVPNAITLMARSLGYSYKELVDKISKGQIESKTALAKMFAEFDVEFGGASERMMTTWVGLVQRLQTRWELFKVAIGRSGYFDEVKKVLIEIVDAFGSERMQVVANEIGKALLAMVRGIKSVVTALIDNWEWIKKLTIALVAMRAALFSIMIFNKVGAGLKLMDAALASTTMHMAVFGATTSTMVGPQLPLIASMVHRVRKAFVALSAVLRANIFGVVLTGIAAFVTYVWSANSALEDLRGKVDEFNEKGAFGATNEDIAEMGDRVAFLNESIDKHTAKLEKIKELDWRQNQANYLEGVLKELLDERERTMKAMNVATKHLDEVAAKEQVEIKKRALHQELDAARGAFRAEYDALWQMLDKSKITQEEYFKQKTAIRYREMEKEKEIIRSAINEQQALIQSGSLSGGELITAQLYVKALREEFEGLAKKTQQYIDLQKQSAEITDGAKQDAIREKKADTLITNLRAKIEELKAVNVQPGAKGYVESLMEKIEQGAFGANQEKLDEIIKLAKQIQAISADTKAQEQARKLGQQVDDLKIKLGLATAEVFTFERALASGKFGDPTALTKQRIEELRGLFSELSDLEWEQEVRKDFEKVEQSFQSLNNTLYDGIVDANDALGKRTDVIQQQFQRQAAIYRAQIENAQFNDRQRRNLEESYYKWYVAQQKRIARETEHPVMKLARDWEQATERMKKAQASWIDDMSKRLTDFVMTGKFDFNDFANAVIEDIIRIRMQEAMSKIIGGILGGFGGFSLSGMDGVNFGSQQDMMLAAQNFANGGIMTPWGTAQLKQYATGGIATSPQVSVFGEGDTPEAYVPLPDGRTIPVTMNGEGGGATSVQVNVINQSGQNVDAKQGQPRFDGEKMVLDVVLSAVSRPGKFRDSMKGALS